MLASAIVYLSDPVWEYPPIRARERRRPFRRWRRCAARGLHFPRRLRPRAASRPRSPAPTRARQALRHEVAGHDQDDVGGIAGTAHVRDAQVATGAQSDREAFGAVVALEEVECRGRW